MGLSHSFPILFFRSQVGKADIDAQFYCIRRDKGLAHQDLWRPAPYVMVGTGHEEAALAKVGCVELDTLKLDDSYLLVFSLCVQRHSFLW